MDHDTVRREAWRSPRVWLIIALYLLLTGWLSFELNLWRDEIYSLHTSSESPLGAARKAMTFELQPPFYFTLLSAWRMLNTSGFFARLLSALCGGGAILASAVLAQRLVPRLDPAWAAAVVASHPFMVWVGTEIRVYALTVLLSVLLLLAFLEAYASPLPRLWPRLAYIALALLAVYTQYYLGALFVCFAVALLVRRDRRKLLQFAMDMAAVGLLCVPLFVLAKMQLGSHKDDLAPGVASGGGAVARALKRFEAYLFSFNKAINEARWKLSTIRAARWAYRALVFGAIALGVLRWRRRFISARVEKVVPLLAIVVVYGILVVVLLHVVGPMSVGERHTAGVLVPLLIFPMAALGLSVGKPAAQAWGALLLVSNVPATYLTQIEPMAKDCDCRRVAETIAGLEADREPILVFPSEESLGLAVYYRGKNRLIPIPGPPNFEHWDQRTFVVDDAGTIADLVDREASEPTGLWVHTGPYGYSWGRDKLEAYLSSGYREEETREFAHGVVLRHIVRSDSASR